MTATTFNTAPTQATDANFRLWGSALSSALTTVGMTSATDTGQVNWTTVLHPTVANTVQGYEIWRFNDGLTDIRFKLEYGSANVATAPSLWLTVGTGSDGAGNITGTLVARVQIGSTSTSTTTFDSYVCFSGSCLVIVMWPGFGSTTPFISVERSRSSAGTVTADAICVHTYGNVTSALTDTYTTVSLTGSPTTKNAIGTFPVVMPLAVANSAESTSTTFSPDTISAPVMPAFCVAPSVTPFTHQAAVALANGDQPSGVTFSFTINGASHSYRLIAGIGATAGPQSFVPVLTAAQSLLTHTAAAFLYE